MGLVTTADDRRHLLRRLTAVHRGLLPRRREAVNAPHERLPDRRLRFRPASWEPGRIDWLAAATQLVGTFLFNVRTFLAMQHGLDARQTNLRVGARRLRLGLLPRRVRARLC
jgi:hypothetical protein